VFSYWRLFAFLATNLTLDTKDQLDLQNDFRKRTLQSGVALAPVSNDWIAFVRFAPQKLHSGNTPCRLQVMRRSFGNDYDNSTSVESLTLGYTLLRTDDNRRVVVPNSVMASQTNINLTTNDPRVICSVLIGISYDSDIDKTRALLLDLAGKHSKALKVCGCPLTQLNNSGVVLSLDVWCADALTAITFRCDLLEQAAKRFAVEGIRISIPQTMVLLKDDRHFNRLPEKTSAGVNTP
jgi:small-conductance mechanosensitive channel